jgi:hypothetical protein
MFCPKCGKENPDNAKLCSSCGSVLTSLSINTENPNAKISGLAIASLVLGIVSFCTFFPTLIYGKYMYPYPKYMAYKLVDRIFYTSVIITAIPAIICGTIALLKIEKSAGQLKTKGIAIVGIALPGASLLIPVLLDAYILSISLR